MMVLRLLFLFFFLLAGLSAFAQVRPDFFPEETNPNNSNFEVYSQKNGVNRRASLANLRKYFGAQIVTGSVPAPTGNSESLRNKIILVLPDSVTYFVDWNGTAVMLGAGLQEEVNGVEDFYYQNDTLFLVTTDSVFLVHIPEPDLSAYAEQAYVDSLHTDLQDSLAVVATRVDTLPTGQGTASRLPIWLGTRQLGNSPLAHASSRLSLDAANVLGLGGITTAQLPSAAAGDFYYESTAGWFQGVRADNTRSFIAQANTATLNATSIPYIDANNRIATTTVADLNWNNTTGQRGIRMGTTAANTAGAARLWILEGARPAIRIGNSSSNLTANADLYINTSRQGINLAYTNPDNTTPAILIDNRSGGGPAITTLYFSSTAVANSDVRVYLSSFSNRLDLANVNLNSIRQFDTALSGNSSGQKVNTFAHYSASGTRVFSENDVMYGYSFRNDNDSTSTTRTKKLILFGGERLFFRPVYASASFVGLSFDSDIVINAQDSSTVIHRGILINPRLKTLGGGEWRALDIETSGTAIRQSHASARNYFRGATTIGATSAPQRQLDIRGGLRILPDSLATSSTRLGGYNAAGDATGITPASEFTIAGDTLRTHTRSGSISDTTDGSGDITVTFSSAMPDTNYAISVTQAGTGTIRLYAAHTKTTTSAKIRVYDLAGAALASSAVTFDYIIRKN